MTESRKPSVNSKASQAPITRWAKQLQPWLEIANVVEETLPIPAERAPLAIGVNTKGLPDLPSNVGDPDLVAFEVGIRSLIVRHANSEQFPSRRFDNLLNGPRGVWRLYDVGYQVRNVLARASQWRPGMGSPVPLSVVPLSSLSWLTVAIENGRYAGRIDDLFRDAFLPVFFGAEPRIRRCPVCGSFFYAIRKNKRGCSQRCCHILRTRHWLKNRERYERNRVAKKLKLSKHARVKVGKGRAD